MTLTEKITVHHEGGRVVRMHRHVMQRVTAEYRGHDRPAYKHGARYNIVLNPVGGHRFLNGEWVPDIRVQVYLQDYDPKRDGGHIMYDSLEEAKKDFAL